MRRRSELSIATEQVSDVHQVCDRTGLGSDPGNFVLKKFDHTEHHSSIATTRGLSLILSIAFLLGALALQSLLSALIELALEGCLLLLVGAASGRSGEESLL